MNPVIIIDRALKQTVTGDQLAARLYRPIIRSVTQLALITFGQSHGPSHIKTFQFVFLFGHVLDNELYLSCKGVVFIKALFTVKLMCIVLVYLILYLHNSSPWIYKVLSAFLVVMLY